VSDDVIRQRLERLAPTQPLANELRELARIIADHGLIDLRPALGVVVDRALEDTFDVAVIGRVSSGKSSLLNALLGAPVLPTGVLPVTAFPTRLRRGPEARLQVSYANGRTEITDVARIAEFVSESGNPGNEKRLTRLVLTYPSETLPADVTFVDTPGLGSVTAASALQTYAYLPRCDHATFLFDASAPVAEEDLTVLAFLHEAGITTSVLLSKTDLLSDSDLDRVRAYVATQLETRLHIPVSVRAMSTVAGREALLQDWIRDEVRPLGRQARQRGHEALARKVDVLRTQAIVALEHQLRGTRAGPGPEQSAPVIAALRDASAGFETASRDLLSLQDRRHALVEVALTAATDALANGGDASTGGAVLRAALIRGSHETVGHVTETLDALCHQAQAALDHAAQATSAPVPMLDLSARLRDTPLLDLPPLTLDLHPPLWAKASRHLLRRWIGERVRDEWQSIVERSAEAFLEVLRRWATDTLTEVRRQYESASRPLLTQLTGTAAPHRTSTGTSGLERDLEWLRHEHLETTDARY
jgi:GTP-binding protein EngB required for normal cell division